MSRSVPGGLVPWAWTNHRSRRHARHAAGRFFSGCRCRSRRPPCSRQARYSRSRGEQSDTLSPIPRSGRSDLVRENGFDRGYSVADVFFRPANHIVDPRTMSLRSPRFSPADRSRVPVPLVHVQRMQVVHVSSGRIGIHVGVEPSPGAKPRSAKAIRFHLASDWTISA